MLAFPGYSTELNVEVVAVLVLPHEYAFRQPQVMVQPAGAALLRTDQHEVMVTAVVEADAGLFTRFEPFCVVVDQPPGNLAERNDSKIHFMERQ